MSDDDLIRKAAAIQAVFDWEQGKISGTIADAIAAIPATDAREKALREAADIAIVLKGNGWDDNPPDHPYDRGYIRACEIIAKRILALIDEART